MNNVDCCNEITREDLTVFCIFLWMLELKGLNVHKLKSERLQGKKQIWNPSRNLWIFFIQFFAVFFKEMKNGDQDSSE